MISAVGGAARNGGHGREGRLVGPAGRSHVKAGGRSMQDDGGEEGMTQLLSSHRWPDLSTPPPDFLKSCPWKRAGGRGGGGGQSHRLLLGTFTVTSCTV